jgi:site-specific DNA recombinase
MRAIVYCRVSSQAQEDGTSLQSQAESCAAHAEQLGYKVTRTVKEVFSGAYLLERPKINEVRDAVRRGQVDAVIVYAVDRLSRDTAHLYIILEELKRFNAELICVSEAFDHTPEGKLLQSVRGYVAEVEREKIKERTMRGRRTAVLNGTINHRRPLYGYTIADNGNREPCPETSHTVKELFARILGGDSLRTISADFSTRGIPTPNGKPTWWAQSLAAILKNPAYAGKVTMFRYKHHHTIKDGMRSTTCKVTDPSEWITIEDGNTPALVTQDDFDAVQAILNHNKKAKRGRAQREFLLRGMVRCAVCGRQMSPQMAKTYRAYVCTSKQNPTVNCGVKMLGAAKAEDAVWQTIVGFIREPQALIQMIEDANASITERIASLHGDLADIDKRIEQCNAAIHSIITRSGTASEKQWAIFEKQLETKQADLDRLTELRADILREQQSSPATPHGINEILRRGNATIDGMDFADRVDLLKSLGLQLKWDGARVKASIYTQYVCQSNFDGLDNKTVNLAIAL